MHWKESYKIIDAGRETERENDKEIGRFTTLFGVRPGSERRHRHPHSPHLRLSDSDPAHRATVDRQEKGRRRTGWFMESILIFTIIVHAHFICTEKLLLYFNDAVCNACSIEFLYSWSSRTAWIEIYCFSCKMPERSNAKPSMLCFIRRNSTPLVPSRYWFVVRGKFDRNLPNLFLQWRLVILLFVIWRN